MTISTNKFTLPHFLDEQTQLASASDRLNIAKLDALDVIKVHHIMREDFIAVCAWSAGLKEDY